jgi:hypothetical protein
MFVESNVLASGHRRVWAILLDQAAAVKSVVRLEKIGIPTTAIFMVFTNRHGKIETTTAERAGLTCNQTISYGASLGGLLGTAVGIVIGVALALNAVPTAMLMGPLASAFVGGLVGALIGVGAGGSTAWLMGTLAATGVPTEVSRQFAPIIERGGVAVVADVPEHMETEARHAVAAVAPVEEGKRR